MARPVLPAPLSEATLPELPEHQPPWPGELLGEVFVRRTPAATGTEPALLVHGLGGSSHNWTDLMALLRDRLACEALDLPGFGHSPVSAAGYGLAAHVAAVVRRIEARDAGPVHLVGNSLGGAVSVVVAARRPDLVRTLTLISPALPTLRLPLKAAPSPLALARRLRGRQTAHDRIQGVLDLCFVDSSVVGALRRKEMLEEARRRGSLGYDAGVFNGSLRGLVASYALRKEEAMWRQLAAVAAPAAVVWGRQDKLVTAAIAARTARTLPDGRLLLLEGVGHVPQMERPDAVARVVLGLVDRQPGRNEQHSASVRGSATRDTAHRPS